MPITEIEKRKTEKILLKQSKSKENKLEYKDIKDDLSLEK